MALDLDNAAHGNVLLAKVLQQQAAGFVVSHYAHRQDVDIKRGKITDGVAASARHHGALAMLQDEHWRLARDPRDFAEDKLIRHQVAQYRDGHTRKCLHYAGEPRV